MISYSCGSNSPPQAENFSVFELNIEFPPFENMISQCKCLHTKIPFPQIYVNILFEILLYVNMFTYESPREVENSETSIFPKNLIFSCALWKLRSPSSVGRFCSYLERFQGLVGDFGFWSQKGSFLTWISQIPSGVSRNWGSYPREY